LLTSTGARDYAFGAESSFNRTSRFAVSALQIRKIMTMKMTMTTILTATAITKSNRYKNSKNIN
jgi:hypothetical protein